MIKKAILNNLAIFSLTFIFLASEASSFCTGIDLIVDGGFVYW